VVKGTICNVKAKLVKGLDRYTVYNISHVFVILLDSSKNNG